MSNCGHGKSEITDTWQENRLAKLSHKLIRFFYLDKIFAENGYLLSSRTPFYGLLITIPLLIVYEMMTLFVGHYENYSVRNYAEILFKELLDLLGLHGPVMFALLVIIVLAVVFYFRDQKHKKFSPSYLGYMFLESTFYAIFLGFIASRFTRMLFMVINPQDQQVSIMLSLGAGFYEELIFRVLLFGITARTLILLKMQKFTAYLISALFSSVLFSWSHYMGSEQFQIISGFFRLFMGILFCVLYKLRGFGITAYTHALYDLFLLVNVWSV